MSTAHGAAGGHRVGLVTDPDFPQTIAESLADQLPDMLGDQQSWSVDVEVDPVAAGQHDVADILQALAQQTGQHDWDYAICLTDLPLRRENRPVLAEIKRDQGVAVLALPSAGGLQPQRRTRQLVCRILDELTAAGDTSEDSRSQARGLQSRLTRLAAPIHRQQLTGEQGAVDVRYHATRRRGRLRLLSGMVRTNRPWRLIFGMSSALAAAVATSAFGLSSSTIWQIAASLPSWREAVAAVASVAVLGGWLIAAHQLWETRSTNDNTADPELVRLYNLSTVATLTIGVGCLYAGLFVINLAVAFLLVPASVLSSMAGSAEPGIYISLAWGFTTMGVLAGALGSSLESDQAVRQAAYGYREQQRRAERATHNESDHNESDHEEPGRDQATIGERDGQARSKDQLYAAAQRAGVRGRSEMTKQQLLEALDDTERLTESLADHDGQRNGTTPRDQKE